MQLSSYQLQQNGKEEMYHDLLIWFTQVQRALHTYETSTEMQMLTLIVWRNQFQSGAQEGLGVGGRGRGGRGRGQANEWGRGGTRGATRGSGQSCVGTGQGWGGQEGGKGINIREVLSNAHRARINEEE